MVERNYVQMDCPECHRGIEYPEDRAGAGVFCPHCNAWILLASTQADFTTVPPEWHTHRAGRFSAGLPPVLKGLDFEDEKFGSRLKVGIGVTASVLLVLWIWVVAKFPAVFSPTDPSVRDARYYPDHYDQVARVRQKENQLRNAVQSAWPGYKLTPQDEHLINRMAVEDR